LEEPKFTLGQLVSLSLGMSFFFGVAQISGFIARILFRATLGPEYYGVFAFLINLFVLFHGLNLFSLNVPIIARISENPSDDAFYRNFSSQVFSTSLIIGLLLSIAFIFGALSVTQEYVLIIYLALTMILYATGQILHCFPRGRERFRPSAISLVLVGLVRIILLVFFMVLGTTNLLVAMLVYTLPFLAWWATYLYLEGIPSLSFPRLKFIVSVYSDAFVSHLYPLSLQIPIVLGIVFLTGFHGFGVAGDFDIALIPYYALTSLLVGISFVIISKARKMPDFRSTMKKMVPSIFLPIFLLCGLIIITAYFVDTPVRIVLTILSLPMSVYWPVVLLISIGITTHVLISFLVSYFQGLGVIKPVGVIAVLCSFGSIPLQIAFAYYYSIEGVVLSIILVNITIAMLLLGYGYRTSKDTRS